jgi:hypothetical protein
VTSGDLHGDVLPVRPDFGAGFPASWLLSLPLLPVFLPWRDNKDATLTQRI